MRLQFAGVVRVIAMALFGVAPNGAVWAALELRDINGHSTPDITLAEFAYDTILDATWFLTANNTGLNWEDSKTWAAELKVGTFGGWSLPAADPPCNRGDVYIDNCTKSQMGELWYIELGHKYGEFLSKTGPFKNLKPEVYWASTPYVPDVNGAWHFNMTNGLQDSTNINETRVYALAIRNGDVAAVPEPGTIALVLSGFAGMMALRGRRPFSAMLPT